MQASKANLLSRNSAALGLYVIMSALFAGILVQPPYLWSFNTLGYVFVGQIATAIAVPIICGWGSDFTTKIMSRRNGGVSEVSIPCMSKPAVMNEY